jgi:peroxiredoxin
MDELTDVSGSPTAVGLDEIRRLGEMLAAAGLDIDLSHRYSVVFFYPGIGAGTDYPELAGCTSELCTFADQTTEFVKHGIQLAGLSTRETKPPGDFLTSFPFPIGRIQDGDGRGIVDMIDKGSERFAKRTSFVVFPDGTGVKVTDVRDPVGHVHRCFDLAIQRRLEEYKRKALSFLQDENEALKTSMTHRGFLSNGADSVSISTVEFKADIVAKMASPDIIGQEAGYMDRINRLLTEQEKPKLFPGVVAINTEERPAYYLMESANPLSLDHLIFEDAAMTRLRSDRLHILTDSLQKLANLYEVTLRNEVPKVASYHYKDRFLAIPQRNDFLETYRGMFGDERPPGYLLQPPVDIDGFSCRSFEDQMRFLEKTIDELTQPVGAYLHGDVHLKNMLVQEDGRSVVFIDPRIVWDGNDVGDPGFGDPLYDYGTLLHSIHFASSILAAIDSHQTEGLLRWNVNDSRGAITITTGSIPLISGSTRDWFLDWLNQSLRPDVRGRNWRARLYVNTANASFGWLKYARAVATPHAWMAFFAATLYYLEMARLSLEGSEGEP